MKKRGRPKGVDGNRVFPCPPHPTRTCPGTEAKIKVMEWRVANGYRPGHPCDYREDRNPT